MISLERGRNQISAAQGFFCGSRCFQAGVPASLLFGEGNQGIEYFPLAYVLVTAISIRSGDCFSERPWDPDTSAPCRNPQAFVTTNR